MNGNKVGQRVFKLFDVEDPVRGNADLFTGGWIKVHRKILFHPYFHDSELLHLFLYCLAKANHRDGCVLWKGQQAIVKRGQFVFGRKKASQETGIKQSSLYRKMMILQNLEILDIKPNNKFSIVTVREYDKSQDATSSSEQQSEQQVNNKRTTSGQQLDTNKNNKNKKNEKKKRIFLPDSVEYELSKLFLNEIRKNDQGFLLDNPDAVDDSTRREESTIQRWAKDFNRLMGIDNRPVEEIKEVIAFAQTNSFWRSTILSANKLREKYTTLLLQTRTPSNNSKESKTTKGAILPCEVVI